jgi:hypothetical protein
MKIKALKRPYVNHYFTDPNARDNAFVSQGFASSPQGAIRACVVRIFMHEYAKCLVYDRNDGTLVYTIKPGASGLQIHYGAATGHANLRRVK